MDFHEAVAELDTLVQTLEREGDERALMLLQLVDAIHRPALACIADGDDENQLVQMLLGMYGLVEVDESVLAEEALDSIRPYVESHGGAVELLSVEDGEVRISMSGACDGCAASQLTLRRGIEQALREHLPGFREVVADVQENGPTLLQIENLRRPVFVDVGAAEELAENALRAEVVDDVPVLLVRLEGEIYALRNGCAVDGLPLDGARFTGDGVLVCPWHNCAYDARSGKRLDDDQQAGLPVVPIAIQDGMMRVAVNVT